MMNANDVVDRIILWSRHQPVIAKFIADTLMVAAVASLHRWGIEVPDLIKGAVDVAVVGALFGTTKAAYDNVKPVVKLPPSDVDSPLYPDAAPPEEPPL